MKDLLKSKTVWAGLATIIAAAQGFFTGSMETAEALQLASTGLIGIFLRHGVDKIKKQ